MDVLASVRQPSTFRMLIWPEASNAQNSIAAVSADGSTVCVLIRRLNSSCRRSIALVVRALRHWLGGSRVKVKLPENLVPRCRSGHGGIRQMNICFAHIADSFVQLESYYCAGFIHHRKRQ